MANLVQFLKRWQVQIALIVLVWAVTHLFTLSWGMPSLRSLAVDTVPATPSYTAYQMMKQDLCKYPPLEYLLWGQVFGPHPIADLNADQLLALTSSQIIHFRALIAVQTLATSLMLFALCFVWLNCSGWSWLAGAFYLISPVSLYYSHTSNVDQASTFWYVLSVLCFIYANPPKALVDAPVTRQARRRSDKETQPHRQVDWRWWLGNGLFGVIMACTFCTKDQYYAIYFLPLLVYLIWQFRKGEKWQQLILQGVTWTIPFVLTTLSIYQIAGDDVLKVHFAWITGGASVGFQLVDNSVLGHLKLIGLSLYDFATCLEWPLTVLFVAATTWIVVMRKQVSTRAIGLLIALAIAWISYNLLFMQIVRSTYVRYYPPLLAFACCVIVVMLHGMANLRRRRLWYGLVALFVALECFMAWQQLNQMTQDPRITVSRKIAPLAEAIPNLLVGIDGLEFGGVYQQIGTRTHMRRIVRDWSNSRLSHMPFPHTAIMVDPYFLSLKHPSLLVVPPQSPEQVALLTACGYSLAMHLEPPAAKLHPLYHSLLTPLDIYRLDTYKTPPQLAEQQLGLADRLLIFRSAINGTITEDTLTNLGKAAPPFKVQDLAGSAVLPDVLMCLAIGYDLNDRVADAEAAFRCLIATDDKNPDYRRRWEGFCKFRGIKP